MTVNELASLLRATEVEIQSLLKDGSLKSLRRHDVEKFLNGLGTFFASLEKQLAAVEKQLRIYCLGRRIFQTELVDAASDGAIDALLRCRDRWLNKKCPVRPERYLAKSVHLGIGSALKDHFDAYQNEFTHAELPDEIEDRREPADDPLDYCRTEQEYDVMACLKDEMTYDEIETETGIDRSKVGRIRAAIQDRFTRLCA